jgi:hypothetical protein
MKLKIVIFLLIFVSLISSVYATTSYFGYIGTGTPYSMPNNRIFATKFWLNEDNVKLTSITGYVAGGGSSTTVGLAVYNSSNQLVDNGTINANNGGSPQWLTCSLNIGTVINHGYFALAIYAHQTSQITVYYTTPSNYYLKYNDSGTQLPQTIIWLDNGNASLSIYCNFTTAGISEYLYGSYTESASFGSIRIGSISKSFTLSENTQISNKRTESISRGVLLSEFSSYQIMKNEGVLKNFLLSENSNFLALRILNIFRFGIWGNNFFFAYNGSRISFDLYHLPSGVDTTTVIINISSDLTILFVILIILNLLLMLIKVPILGVIIALLSISLGAISINGGVVNPYFCIFVILMGLINIILNALDMRK